MYMDTNFVPINLSNLDVYNINFYLLFRIFSLRLLGCHVLNTSPNKELVILPSCKHFHRLLDDCSLASFSINSITFGYNACCKSAAGTAVGLKTKPHAKSCRQGSVTTSVFYFC